MSFNSWLRFFLWFRQTQCQPCPPSEHVSATVLGCGSVGQADMCCSPPKVWCGVWCSGSPSLPLECLCKGSVGRALRREAKKNQSKKKIQFHAQVLLFLADVPLHHHQRARERPHALLLNTSAFIERCHLIGNVTSMRSTSSSITSGTGVSQWDRPENF